MAGLDVLPEELLLGCFSHLNLIDCVRAQYVSKRFHNLVFNAQLALDLTPAGLVGSLSQLSISSSALKNAKLSEVLNLLEEKILKVPIVQRLTPTNIEELELYDVSAPLLLALVRVFPNLRSLVIVNSDLELNTDGYQDYVPHSNGDYSSSPLFHLSRLSRFTAIDCNFDSHFIPLCNYTNLEKLELDIYNAPLLFDEIIAALPSMKRLRFLKSSFPLPVTTLQLLPLLQELHHVLPSNDRDFGLLVSSTIRTLSLSGTGFLPNFIQSMPSLRSLSLNSFLSMESQNAFRIHATKLRIESLELDAVEGIAPTILTSLPCAGLTSLKLSNLLSGEDLTECIRAIPRFNHLRTLRLHIDRETAELQFAINGLLTNCQSLVDLDFRRELPSPLLDHIILTSISFQNLERFRCSFPFRHCEERLANLLTNFAKAGRLRSLWIDGLEWVVSRPTFISNYIIGIKSLKQLVLSFVRIVRVDLEDMTEEEEEYEALQKTPGSSTTKDFTNPSSTSLSFGSLVGLIDGLPLLAELTIFAKDDDFEDVQDKYDGLRKTIKNRYFRLEKVFVLFLSRFGNYLAM